MVHSFLDSVSRNVEFARKKVRSFLGHHVCGAVSITVSLALDIAFERRLWGCKGAWLGIATGAKKKEGECQISSHCVSPSPLRPSILGHASDRRGKGRARDYRLQRSFHRRSAFL